LLIENLIVFLTKTIGVKHEAGVTPRLKMVKRLRIGKADVRRLTGDSKIYTASRMVGASEWSVKSINIGHTGWNVTDIGGLSPIRFRQNVAVAS
jgi:hypothetical protein